MSMGTRCHQVAMYVVMQDGINADRVGNDYKKVDQPVTKDTKLTIRLAPGGWAAIISAPGQR